MRRITLFMQTNERKIQQTIDSLEYTQVGIVGQKLQLIISYMQLVIVKIVNYLLITRDYSKSFQIIKQYQAILGVPTQRTGQIINILTSVVTLLSCRLYKLRTYMPQIKMYYQYD